MATEQGVVTINYNQFRRCGGDNKGTAVNQFRFKSQHSTNTIENKLQKLKDALVLQSLQLPPRNAVPPGPSKLL